MPPDPGLLPIIPQSHAEAAAPHPSARHPGRHPGIGQGIVLRGLDPHLSGHQHVGRTSTPAHRSSIQRCTMPDRVIPRAGDPRNCQARAGQHRAYVGWITFSTSVSPVSSGFSEGSGGDTDYLTVAYAASNGARVWTKRNGGQAGGNDAASSLTLLPGTSTLVVTGDSPGAATGWDVATVAYDAKTGDRIWSRRYDGPAGLPSADFAETVLGSPDGSAIFVAERAKATEPARTWPSWPTRHES
jgi:hypothetical protein